ncbi:MAG TPA: hypothetical protein VLB27_02290, partial [candidate division Zixibacteria bacterium]|nr:hypothetical protein [candidate division Zixibacteria bacterium]
LRNMLVWTDRDGIIFDTLGRASNYRDVRLSPDEKRIVFSRLDEDKVTEDIWVMDLQRKVTSRLTFEDKVETCPTWSVDGKYVYYISDRDGKWKILRRQASGIGGVEEVYTSSQSFAFPGPWLPDGKTMLISQEVTGGTHILALSTDDGTVVEEILTEPFNMYAVSLTRDGRYLAYYSNESGRDEVYVRDIGASGGKWQISSTGGDQPVWSADESELYFWSENSLLVVPVDFSDGSFSAGMPDTLFTRVRDQRGIWNQRYSVTRDGQRILMNARADEEGGSEFVVVLNWYEGIRK